jgi:hypothetical protein
MVIDLGIDEDAEVVLSVAREIGAREIAVLELAKIGRDGLSQMS